MRIRHDRLHQLFWGPASRKGRNSTTDRDVQYQLGLYMISFLYSAALLTSPKNDLLRRAAYLLLILTYYRSVSLYLRLIVLFTIAISIGDILIPLFSSGRLSLMIFFQFLLMSWNVSIIGSLEQLFQDV